MYTRGYESLEPDDIEEKTEREGFDNSFESSFTYHAVPLDEQMTLDENNIPFTLQELMDIKEIREEYDKQD